MSHCAPRAAAGTPSDWIVIGISGVTCGGKTTLAARLLAALGPVFVFHQDKYFFADDSARHVRCAGLAHNNYDVLTALDMQAMHKDIMSTMQGKNKAHAWSAATEGRLVLRGKKFLVVEGFTALNYKPICDLCNLRYYFVLEYGECAARRALRLYDPPDVEGYFEKCVWPEHLRYKAEIEKDGRVRMLDGTQPDAFETVMSELEALSV